MSSGNRIKKILIIGGGPAGLYCGILLKKANPSLEIAIVERNPPDATYGWGVVFSDRTLAEFREADYPSYTDITDRFVVWDAIDVYYRGERIRCGGQIFAGISRRALLAILQRHCEERGVRLRFRTEVSDLVGSDADLVIGADGVNSMVRSALRKIFKASLEEGRSKYIWLGTRQVLGAFTFIFRQSEHGLFQVHAYPYDGHTSTFIVECDEATWRRAGLDTMDDSRSLAFCESLFRQELGGHPLMSNNSKWINFITVKNETWHYRNIVLLGDAAHTAHFSIGSGTKLAMEDAIALSHAIEQHPDIQNALVMYEMERKPAVETFQEAARSSRRYFENVERYIHLDPAQFTFHLLTRSGRISYDDLRLRDALFVDRVDREMTEAVVRIGHTTPTAADPVGALRVDDRTEQDVTAKAAVVRVAHPPAFQPRAIRGMMLHNRICTRSRPAFSAEDGLPGAASLDQLRRLALGGAALVVTEALAVSTDGRITPGDPGMYRADHVAAWAALVDFIHTRTSARIALFLNHAGRRGSTRPRWQGSDRPLREGSWPLLSASPLAYTPGSQTPREMARADMDRIVDAFVRAGRLAQEAGFDMLHLHWGHGYLLGSFLSPLTNRRGDEYGGPLENRLRFPLEFFDAIRVVWAERPLSVALNATDWERGGADVEEGVEIARILKAHGCDAIEVLAGQTTPASQPAYGRAYLTSYSDVIRNETRIVTMVGGHLTRTGDMNTILAAGRADLCITEETGTADLAAGGTQPAQGQLMAAERKAAAAILTKKRDAR